MKDATIAPYIVKHKELIAGKVHALELGRVSRLKSAIFSMPEFDNWEDISTIFIHESIEKGGCNNVMMVNKMAVDSCSKIICFSRKKQGISDEIQSAYSRICSDENDLIVINSRIAALSFELFILAQGLDELIESVDDALDDLLLRAELLGGNLSAEEWDKGQVSGLARKNIEKGRLIVNQGSELFS